MEQCMEAKAFKSSLGRELAMKSTQHVFIGELWCGDTGISCLPASDDFSVDDLLDLSNGNFEDNSVEEEEEKDTGSVEEYETSNVSSFTDSPLATQFSVPDDYLAELEWVSHFVDDSVSELSLLQQEPTLTKNRSEPEPKRVESRFPWLPSHIPVKSRTKRFRPTGRVRSLWSPPGDSPSITSYLSSPSSSTCSSLSTSYLVVTNRVWNMGGFLGEPAAKRQKITKPAFENGSEVLVQFQRRCSHCQVQKTPQWRTGPHGPKTLCNACGVRYKSNRLFPEYRPACSPTFSGDVHSNSHRKVLEIRRTKDSGTVNPKIYQSIRVDVDLNDSCMGLV